MPRINHIAGEQFHHGWFQIITGIGLRLVVCLSGCLTLQAHTIDTASAQTPAPPIPETAVVSFNIPAQPLGSALNAFAETTGWQISLSTDLADGTTSTGVAGNYAPEQALRTMLTGIGLTYRLIAPHTVMIERLSSSGPVPGIAAGAAARTAAVGSETGELPSVQSNRKPVKVPEILVKDVREKDTALLGPPPAEYAGGQVATGGQVGLLGNRDLMNTPFSQTNYTEKLIRDQQARTVGDVLMNDPTVRSNVPHNAEADQFLVRGFRMGNTDFALGGLFGLLDPRQPAIENVERVEILRGPAALLYGVPPSGFIGGTINLIPKRATDAPITRLIGSYASDSNAGGWLDVGRRFGQNKEFGVRMNGSYYTGDTPIGGQWYNRGLATLGLDYTTHRLRISADAGYNSKRWQRSNRVMSVLPGFQIPTAPDATRSVQQPWERYDSQHAYGMLRAEYDVLPNVTVFGTYGRAQFFEKYDLVGSAALLNGRGDVRLQPFVFPRIDMSDSAQTGIRSSFSTGPIAHKVSAIASGLWLRSYSAATFVGGPILSNLYSPTDAAEPARLGVDLKAHRASTSTLTSLAIADELSILNDRVQLIVGVRGQRIETANFSPSNGAQTSSYDKAAVTPAVGLVLRPWDRLSFYANYIEGLSAGPTAPFAAVNANETFAPFVSRQYEVGTKLDLNGVGATLALFQITQPFSFTNPVSNRFGVDGEQRNRGVELTLFGAPAEGARLLGGASLIEGTQVRTAGGFNDGKTAIGVPEIMLNLYGEYDLPWLKGFTLTGRGIYTSSQYYDAANSQSIPYWTRFDAGARYAFVANGRPLVARFNVENIANNNYWQSTGAGFLTLGIPRTFLLSLQADF